MAIQINTLPDAPSRTDDQQTFTTKANNLVAALPPMVVQINEVTNEVEANATTAESAATTATTQAGIATAAASVATSASTASAWVNGNTYALNTAAISQLDFQTYRKKTASSVTTIDPRNDSINWVMIGAGIGFGGETASGTVVLTAASGGAQSITPSAPGQSVVLPNATTCSESASWFNIQNKGEHDLAIKNNSGQIKGFVRPYTNCIIGLADNSTSDGVWNLFGTELVGVTAQRELSTVPSNSGNVVVTVALDSNRTCLVYGGSTLYAQIYDKSTQTWGAVVTVATSARAGGHFRASLAASNLVVVAFVSSAVATQALTLSVSGTTITPNTLASGGSGSVNGTMLDFIPVGSAFVIAWLDGSSVCRINGITISGTTITFGASTTTTSTNITTGMLFATSSTVVMFVCANAGNAIAQCFSLSGANPTPGTENVVTPGGAVTLNRIAVLGTGRYLLSYGASGVGTFARLYSVSGTTITTSETSFAAETLNSTQNDWFATANNKVVVGYCLSGDSNFYTRIITDTSGTVSVSSAANVLMSQAVTSVAVLGNSSGTTAKFVSYNTVNIQTNHVDGSGATPVIIVKHRVPVAAFADKPSSTTNKTARSSQTLNNNTVVVPYPVTNLESFMILGEKINKSNMAPVVLGTNSGVLSATSGQNSRETWSVIFSGASIQLLEMAE